MPMKLLHKGQWQAVTRYWGPEKIESGWWRGHALRRDYYRLELSSGLRFWVYRTLPKGEWFLQGSF
jgi:protein ImuB